LLMLTISYLMTKPERISPSYTDYSVRRAASLLDWRLTAILCVPLTVLTYQGRGYNNALAVGTSSTSTDLATTFLIVLVALTAFGFLLRYGMRWFVAAVLIELAILAAAGERLALVIGTVTLIALLAQAGLRPTGRQVGLVVLLTLVGVVGITGYRTTTGPGRSLYYHQTSLGMRLAAVGSGIYGLTHTSDGTNSGPGVVSQFASRMDGDAFAGGILQSMHAGDRELGSLPAAETTLIAVPSFLWNAKLSHSALLSPTGAEIADFHLQDINFLPTLLGLYFGFIGPYWSIFFAMILGALCGWGERWLFKSSSAVRLVILAVAMQAALTYEKGLPGMLIELRTAIVLSAAVWLIGVVRTGPDPLVVPSGIETAVPRREPS